MSNVIPFKFKNSDVRVITDARGEPWFVAKDVATLLGYKRTADAIRTHCKGVGEMQTPINGVTQTIKLIPERDVYRLIMRSKLPAAEAFEEWVVGEVLPAIRKTDGYGLNAIDFNNPQQVAGLLAQSLQRAQQQDKAISELTPKAEALDRIASSDGSLCITNAAKDLQVRPKELFAWLDRHRWIYRRAGGTSWIAYQDRLQAGHLEHKVTLVTRADGTDKSVEQVRVTPKGLAKLAGAFGKQAANH